MVVVARLVAVRADRRGDLQRGAGTGREVADLPYARDRIVRALRRNRRQEREVIRQQILDSDPGGRDAALVRHGDQVRRRAGALLAAAARIVVARVIIVTRMIVVTGVVVVTRVIVVAVATAAPAAVRVAEAAGGVGVARAGVVATAARVVITGVIVIARVIVVVARVVVIATGVIVVITLADHHAVLG